MRPEALWYTIAVDDTSGDKLKITVEPKTVIHYYGDNVRRYFLAGAVVMLLSLPLVYASVRVPAYISVFVIILLGLSAGFTNPRQRSAAILNVVIAMAAVFVFENEAVLTAGRSGETNLYFWINQVLAVIFLVALYYGIKTLRSPGARD